MASMLLTAFSLSIGNYRTAAIDCFFLLLNAYMYNSAKMEYKGRLAAEMEREKAENANKL